MKYRYKVREGAVRERTMIIRQVCKELGVQIVSGVLSREHVPMFVEIPPHIAVSGFVRRVKGRSLSVTLSATSPDGFMVYSHAGDDWQACRDHVRARLGLSPFN